MANTLLLIIPITLIIILFAGAKPYKKGEYAADLFELNNAKNLQIIAAFMIIVHHLVQHISDYGNRDCGPITIMNNCGILFTSIFFFSSGYGLISSYLAKENYLKEFFLKRLTKILLPFYLLNVIYLIPCGLAEGRVRTVLDALKAIFGLTLMNTNAWFIVEIAVFYIVFYITFKHIKNKKNAIWAITIFSILLIIVSLLLGHDHSNINGHWFMGEWWYNTTILFPFGLIVGYNKEKIQDFIKRYYIQVCIISVALFVIAFIIEEIVLKKYGYYVESYTYMGYKEKAYTLIAQSVLCICFMTMLVVLNYKIKTGNIILKIAAPISLELYLVHGLFLVYYDSLNKMPEFIHFTLTIIGSTLIATALYFFDKYTAIFIIAFKHGEYTNKAQTIEGKLKEKVIHKKVKKYLAIIGILALITLTGTVCTVIVNTIGRKIMIDKEITAIGQANIGDTVNYGHYSFEKIKWVVLDKKDDKALLISKYALFEYYYNQKHAACDYERSDLRSLLINEVYNECFYKQERESIVPYTAVKDPVFVLSVDEANLYFDEDIKRVCRMYEYMVEEKEDRIVGIWWNGKGKGPIWWLRSDEYSIKAPVVFKDGSIFDGDDGKNVNMASGGVRPAIWVKY